MTKQEKIEEAYGEYWERVKDYVDENGFIWQSNMFFPKTEMMDKIEIQVKSFPPHGTCKWRPKTIQGIESNHGWIKIESENDLPKENVGCFFLTKNKDCVTGRFFVNHFKGWTNVFTIDNIFAFGIDCVTHYQPIVKPQPPIY